ncbi:30S ribosomal protein S11 [Candidatus Woesebacteria bacterium RBG_16_34_12]|uniref:Small ribosomal subunit protein uS11 n=1 Tax=Candidatus Woesebacteria bacterium RBG_16_34_12 TaxID=1802480 RepID=A0A1F7X998_9BACT|nr:MAG: 30S ribosomal protein S11 [Candidatus Woesebacteria bacterium RBG_16_34_12]
MADKKVKKKIIKKKRESVKFGKIYISASFNNTLVTITDQEGETLCWGSGGESGFKGTRKSTPFAATTAVEKTVNKAKKEYGLDEAEVYIKGPGPGRDASLRAIRAVGLKVNLIADVTPIPHNGPRAKKKRKG